jgi:hypothetical protein
MRLWQFSGDYMNDSLDLPRCSDVRSIGLLAKQRFGDFFGLKRVGTDDDYNF